MPRDSASWAAAPPAGDTASVPAISGAIAAATPYLATALIPFPFPSEPASGPTAVKGSFVAGGGM
ncbi:hypothetical protein GCM10010387_31100 [Streptomyces inusitatus]|uniref:Uncharacterized protein n=1 Tax=Streptomyces inusitatus TaxID=68221 RepID=A0A918Q5J0_9ACTN|nr:hypothetical protein GCM10010387_31100 [Streptomyces inusitatus]